MTSPDPACSYDAIPYPGSPVAETHPDHLAAVGALFGLDVPHPERCRLLELGCANGANLIPMAWHLPESRFVGVDLSPVQVARGDALARDLGLSNLHLQVADIRNLPESMGPFDYIIAHGIYSWVPEEVQEKILSLCAASLSPQGVAYISFNTLPGWRLRGTVRDILLDQTRHGKTPRERLTKALTTLEFLQEAYAALDTPLTQALLQEVIRLRQRPPGHLFHEYLEEYNTPCLLRDFIEKSRQHGLEYVADCDLSRMFPHTLGERGAALFQNMSEPLEVWQHLDFLHNRAFRQALFCRQGVTISREPLLERLESLYYHARVAPVGSVDLRRARPVPFATPEGERFFVQRPMTRAALQMLADTYPRSWSWPELAQVAWQRIAAFGLHQESEGPEYFGELAALLLRGAVGMSVRAYGQAADSVHPQATPLALAQIRHHWDHLATVRHQVMPVTEFTAALLPLLDGVSDEAQIRDRLLLRILQEPHLLDPHAASWNEKRLLRALTEKIADHRSLFAHHGILVAAD
ncbi:MAG: class I SAM-dependent methyltransferase [Magnetococcus sp. DMHC-1]